MREIATIKPGDADGEPVALARTEVPTWVASLIAAVQSAARAGETITVTADVETLSPAEVAKVVGISRASVQRRIASGDIRSMKRGGRYRVPRQEVERFRASFVTPGHGRKYSESRNDVVRSVSELPAVVRVRGMAVVRSMTDEELQAVIPIPLVALRQVLAEHGVEEAYLFGSRSRGHHRPDSDIDLLCPLLPDRADILNLLSLQEDLAAASPVNVDVATDIKGPLKAHIAPDLVKVF